MEKSQGLFFAPCVEFVCDLLCFGLWFFVSRKFFYVVFRVLDRFNVKIRVWRVSFACVLRRRSCACLFTLPSCYPSSVCLRGRAE